MMKFRSGKHPRASAGSPNLRELEVACAQGILTFLRVNTQQVALVGPTISKQFGAKHQMCPHVTVRRPADSTWNMGESCCSKLAGSASIILTTNIHSCAPGNAGPSTFNGAGHINAQEIIDNQYKPLSGALPQAKCSDADCASDTDCTA